MWGTAEVDVNQRADTTIACWRATGTTRTLAGVPLGSVDIAGSWISSTTADGRVLRFELVSGATDAIDAPDAGWAAIDAGGSVAWLGVRDDHGLAPLWVHDASGTHLADAGTPENRFGFDGSTLIWGGRSAPVTP